MPARVLLFTLLFTTPLVARAGQRVEVLKCMVNLRNPLAEQQQTQALLLHHKPGQIAIPRLRELMQGPLGRRQRLINTPQRHIRQFGNLLQA